MTLPRLTTGEIEGLIPSIESIGEPLRGGQKIVYPCIISGKEYALKVMLVNPSQQPQEPGGYSVEAIDEVTARARREIETLSECDIPYMVKPGPIGLTVADIGDQRIIYFTEEWVGGRDLNQIIQQDGPLPLSEVTRLCKNIAFSVNELSKIKKVHRDIKPKNIMRRDATDDFVLIDLGLAFDLDESSITPSGLVPGTLIYSSPEQINFASKRQLDFRSDLFSLGITLYEATTGRHPYYVQGMNTQEIITNILFVIWEPPSVHRREIPLEMDKIIQRLMDKQPHMRYRNCDQLLTQLDAIPLG